MGLRSGHYLIPGEDTLHPKLETSRKADEPTIATYAAGLEVLQIGDRRQPPP